jgi:hypothetical protein
MLNSLIILDVSPFWKWWGIYMILIGVLYVIGQTIEDNKKPISNTKKYNFKKKYSINVTKVKFVNTVIDWCKENMEYPKHHKYYPTVEVKYYINKKISGDYSSKSRVIRIFINNHKSIDELVNTIIHEYTHYLQMPRDTNQLEYTKYNKTKGYYNNPYEIDAREKAEFYTPKCIKDLSKLNYISKN